MAAFYRHSSGIRLAVLARTPQPRHAQRFAASGNLAAGNLHGGGGPISAVAPGAERGDVAAATERGGGAGGCVAQHGFERFIGNAGSGREGGAGRRAAESAVGPLSGAALRVS